VVYKVAVVNNEGWAFNSDEDLVDTEFALNISLMKVFK